MYEKLQKRQEQQMNQKEEAKIDPKDVKNLVDKNMIDLLRACSMLTRPTQEEIEQRKVAFGERTRQKTLILDMDETLIHSKFYKLTGNEADTIPDGLVMTADGAEFNILISNNPSMPPSMRLNVKVRQHLEEALTYLSNMYEICVFTAGE